MKFDVTTMHGRRADERWNRVAVADAFERLTWSVPDKVAITGWVGAYATEEFQRLTYRRADEAANWVAQPYSPRDSHRATASCSARQCYREINGS